MKIYNLPHDLKVFGLQVKSFPAGVQEAFDSLIKKIPGGLARAYYGISFVGENGQMIYYATAREEHEGEAEKYNYTPLVISKGEYLGSTLSDWHSNIHCIKDVFRELMQDSRVDKTKPAVEWYKDEHEMMCMVQTVNQN